MAWRIDTWSTGTGTGSIRSPHYGPIAFDAHANVDGVTDFETGEAVVVELEGTAPDFVVLKLWPEHQRQPAGTHCALFDDVGRFGDLYVDERTSSSIVFWYGDCCGYCTPNAQLVRFDGVSAISGLDDAVELDSPLFRYASDEEIQLAQLFVPAGSQAFCIVTGHGNGHDGPSIYVVAKGVSFAPAVGGEGTLDHD